MPAPNQVAALRKFTETTGAGVYSASVHVPAGALIRSVRYYNRVAWTAATSAALLIGTTESGNDLLTSANLKSAISIHDVAITELDAAQPTPTAGVTVFAQVTTVGTTGNAGRGELEVVYQRLSDGAIAAVKD